MPYHIKFLFIKALRNYFRICKAQKGVFGVKYGFSLSFSYVKAMQKRNELIKTGI
jgi:hypothetical protein